MCMRLRGLLLSALVIAVTATDGAHARHYPPPTAFYAAVVSRSLAPRLPPRIEPWAAENSRRGAGASRLGASDGWARDDHAGAAAFYAAAVRSTAPTRSCGVRPRSRTFVQSFGRADTPPMRAASKTSAPVRSRGAASHARRRGSSSKPISFPCVSAGSAIPPDFSPGTMSRLSTGRASQPGNSLCRCTVGRAIWWRRAYRTEAHFPTTAALSGAPRLEPPYYDRGQIEDGALDGRHLKLLVAQFRRRARRPDRGFGARSS
jgi:hypothetical protein